MKGQAPEECKNVTRRQFLKMAGLAGAAVGVAAGTGGLLAACGEEVATTTTGAPTTSTPTTSGPVTSAPVTTAATTATTVSAGEEKGRDLVVGFVSPQTGNTAAFGVPDGYTVSRWEEATKEGIVTGDGKKRSVKWLMRDMQSDTNRAAQVTGDLINNDKADMIVVASAPDTVLPVVDQCEALEIPCLCTTCPTETFFLSRGVDPHKEYKWGYNFFWRNQDLANMYIAMWPGVSNNKKLGFMFPNDADGQGDRQVSVPLYEAAGYKVVDGGMYQVGTENFTDSIAKFKGEGVEIVIGDMIPPDFTNFWKQSFQQHFRPKVTSMMKAVLFPESLEAVGDIGNYITTEAWWHPTFPYKSSLTGESCQELADHFEQAKGRQWTQPIGQYSLGEWAVDVFKRATDPEDKETLVQAIRGTKLDTIEGPIDFASPVDTDNGLHCYPNACRSPVVGIQWVPGKSVESKYPFESVVVVNPLRWAQGIEVTHQIQPMAY